MYKHKFNKQSIDVRDIKFKLEYTQLISLHLPSILKLNDNIKLPVLSQGDLGSCTANAISNAILYDLKKNKKMPYQPSRLYIYYFSRFLEDNVDDDSGCNLRDAMKAIVKFGACDELLYPYKIQKFNKMPNKICIKQGKQRIKKIKYMSVCQNLNTIKNCLFNNYPIILGIELYDSSESDESLKSGNIQIPNVSNETYIGGHCILLMGYNDEKKIFYFLNSWGADAGENGYFYIPYSYILDSKLAMDFWIIQSVN